ncbi:MAG: hypothetical protein HYX69_19635 [Planctomycetia bacterium]|nr:hypothetical protein [Planctomycetia bacterium]
MSVFVGALGVPDRADAAPRAYYVTDLGTLGGTDSRGWGLNAGGQVAGYAATTDDATVDAFLWTPTSPNATTGTIKDLGTLGGTYAWGVGINGNGQVAGVSATTGDAAEHATLWSPTTPGGTNGTLYDLGTLGGTYSQANGVNASGQVAGYSDMPGDVDSHAFMWKPTTPGGAAGAMYDLGSLGGPFTIAWDINNSGQVAGSSDTTEITYESSHAFLWQPTTPNGTGGTINDLGTLGGSSSDGNGINNAGQVTGSSRTTDDVAVHAFRWTPSIPGSTSGTMQDIGTLGGLNSYGYAVSAAGNVVGMSEVDAQVSNNTHAFLYASDTGMVDLNTLVDSFSGWELLDAYDINDAGQIAGQGLINGEYHAYLLTPLIAGDVNHDGIVDVSDIQTVAANWLTTGPTGDANSDGLVDISDIQTIAAHWLESSGAGNSTVPEPSSLVLSAAIVFSLVGAARLRRQRYRESDTTSLKAG